MKFNIWEHEEMLRNWRVHLLEQREEAEGIFAALKEREEAFSFYEKQVEEAKKRGMDGFDASRFLKGGD